jgi:hypothetical protein
VVAFYTAVHLVEALFDRDGIGHSSDHASRIQKLKENRRYRTIYLSFRPLKAASEIARYLTSRSDQGRYSTRFTDDMPLQDVRTLLVDRYLRNIEEEVKRLLQTP